MELEHSTISLWIEGYASDGAGIARHEGRVIFVKGAMAGERCQVYIDKVGKSAIWGHVVAVEQSSPARITPDCPYYGQCGGCQLRHMTYEEELELKRNRVQEAIRRIGGIDLPITEIFGNQQPDRYRNKVQFPVAKGQEKGQEKRQEGKPSVGYYRQRTHSVIDVADCYLQVEGVTALRNGFKQWMVAFQIAPYEERTGKGLIRHFYVRNNRKGELLCCIVINGKKVSHEAQLIESLRGCTNQLVGIVLNYNTKKTNVILGENYRTLWGQDFLMDTLCGLDFELSVPSFYQINPPQTEVLYGKAIEFSQLTGEETVVDLYCGIGTISLSMAQKAKQVYGVEVVPQAIENAKENAKRNGITNAEFFCADAGEAATQLANQGVRPQVICVDPPRKGLAPDVIETIAKMAPDRVVYVSCDPATLARDLALFQTQGYRATKGIAVDLFSRTVHIESVLCLVRQ